MLIEVMERAVIIVRLSEGPPGFSLQQKEAARALHPDEKR
jgi:hypothetical protein